MYAAELTERPTLKNRAAPETLGRVVCKLLAGGAYGGSVAFMFFASAVQAYHQRNDFLLPHQALFYGGRFIGCV
jgi:hypothetical protein